MSEDIKLWTKEERDKARGNASFNKSIKVWNENHFNSMSNIGYAMFLTRDCKPSNFEDWEQYYLSSGELAIKLKDRLPGWLSRIERKQEIKNIDRLHGKTKDQLCTLAMRFKYKCGDENPPLELSEEEAFNYVYIRAVDEAYLGYQREIAAEKWLEDFCDKNGFIWYSTDETTDKEKGVDYEIRKKRSGDLVCGIQTKGNSYKKNVKNSEYFAYLDSRLVGQIAQYRKEHDNAPVFFLYVKKDFKVYAEEDLKRNITGRFITMSLEKKNYLNRTLNPLVESHRQQEVAVIE